MTPHASELYTSLITLPNHICGSGQFDTDTLVHLRFTKSIVSGQFCNRRTHFKATTTVFSKINFKWRLPYHHKHGTKKLAVTESRWWNWWKLPPGKNFQLYVWYLWDQVILINTQQSLLSFYLIQMCKITKKSKTREIWDWATMWKVIQHWN